MEFMNKARDMYDKFPIVRGKKGEVLYLHPSWLEQPDVAQYYEVLCYGNIATVKGIVDTLS